ncbi:MAG TPA: FAD-dependent oxidoreductase [Candidatus Dormibacteraeota bacterium]|nr:FAD-dependent oxidoreductase [Candidatus Dormibacteraeota bacterium]
MTTQAAIDTAPSAAPGFWLAGIDDAPCPMFEGAGRVDVAIVGGGFTGLWSAIRLLETDPALRVAVLEAETVGYGASGRNGGFCEASLTHGLANGIAHWPEEARFLEEEGVRNLAELVGFVRTHAIECGLEETGTIRLADRPHQAAELLEWAGEARRWGQELTYLDRDAAREAVHSPLWQAGLRAGPEQNVLVDPARVCVGLKGVARSMGADVHERTRVRSVERIAGGVRVTTSDGARLDATSVVVATSAYSGWLRRLTTTFVPVYDYALVSDALTAGQRAAVGWHGREGLSDVNNQFHYFRLTPDDRILWGGYDAVYHGGVAPAFDRRPATFARLEAHFFRAFPQLDGLRFPYRWGGAVDTTTRFTVTFGRTLGDRVVYALGYTGLGVGVSRWAAGILRDMLLRPDSELLRLRFVRSSPFPIPPEPLRKPAVGLMRTELDRADRDEGRRGLFLRTMDALGIGFDS